MRKLVLFSLVQLLILYHGTSNSECVISIEDETAKSGWVNGGPKTRFPTKQLLMIISIGCSSNSHLFHMMIVLEHNMKSPQNFLGIRGIMPWCMFVVMSLYMSLGLCSYLRYGKNTKESVIESLPQDRFWSNLAQIMVALAIFGSYPIQCYVGLEIIWGNYLVHWIKGCDKDCMFEYALRTTFVVLSFAIAIATVKVNLVVSFVGVFCLSTLGLVIPFLLELCTKWPDLGFFKYILIKDLFCITLGFSILTIGTYTSILEIIKFED